MISDKLTDAEICSFIFDRIKRVENGDTGTAFAVYEEFVKIGFEVDAFVGAPQPFDCRTTMIWYVGQFMEIVANHHWFAMNSLVGCVEKFTVDAMKNS